MTTQACSRTDTHDPESTLEREGQKIARQHTREECSWDNAHGGEEWHTHTHTGMVLEENTHTHSLTYECSRKDKK